MVVVDCGRQPPSQLWVPTVRVGGVPLWGFTSIPRWSGESAPHLCLHRGENKLWSASQWTAVGLSINTPCLAFPEKLINVSGNKTKKIINKPDSSQYMTMETRNQKRKQNPSNLGREIFEIEKKRSLFENFVLKIHQRSVFSNVLWKRHLVQQPWSLGLGAGLPYPVQTEARGPRHPMISGERKSSGWDLRKRSICELNFYWEDIPSDLE